MKRFPPSFPLLLTLSACATAGSNPGLHPGPLDWPPGRFHLQGTVQYDNDTGAFQTTATDVYWANLTIDPDGTMHLESSAGLCRETPPTEVSQQLARGLRKFPCENVVYTLRPAGSTIIGEMSVSITQAYREQGRPLASCPKEACQVYSYRVRERQISRTVNLRVEPRG